MVNDTNLHAAATRGVISDFDDTLIVSDTHCKIELLKNVFFKSHTERLVVPNMVDRIENILKEEQKKYFYVITSSPIQLAPYIHGFLSHNHFPPANLIAKKLWGKGRDPLWNTFAYKTEKIQKVIETHPEVLWTLFGDSAAKDKEIYKEIYNRFPEKIDKIFIRDVHTGRIENYLPSLKQP